MSRGNTRTLSRVIPIAQKREAGGITVTLSALELYEGGRGTLRHLISYGPQTVFRGRFGGGSEPEIEARDAITGGGWGGTAAGTARRKAPWKYPTYRTPESSR